MKNKIMNFYGLEYKVFDDGSIIGCSSGKKLKQRLDVDGYPTVTLGKFESRTSKKVHSVMALTFLEKPEDFEETPYDVDHIDNNRENNNLSNLQYLTHSDNVRKSYESGGQVGTKLGEANGRSVYTIEQVLKIRDMYKNGIGIMDIIKHFHPTWNYYERRCKWNTVKHICDRDTWKHI